MNELAPRLLTLAVVLALTGCGDTPEGLAGRVESALESGDADALVANTEIAQAPAMMHYVLLDLPNKCGADVVCTVVAKPVDPAWEKSRRERAAQQGMELSETIAGVLEIKGHDSKEPDASKNSLKLELPFAKVGEQFKIVSGRLTDAKLAELEATSAQATAEALLAEGIHDPQTNERDTAWKSKATPLAADGGEPGRAYLAEVEALATAVAANDVDAAAKVLGAWGAMVLGPADHSGKPVPLASRQLKLRAQATRFVLQTKVLGGWQLGNTAVLVIEGVNGAGAAVRGAQLMSLQGGRWTQDVAQLVEIPKRA